MQYIIFSLCLLLGLNQSWALSSNYLEVSTLKSPPFIDGRGEAGFDGIDGEDAKDLECDEGIKLKGDNGKDGADGEDGQRGSDVIVYYTDISELSHFTLDLSGGLGGNGGLGGFGGKGCFGGKEGKVGESGSVGFDGETGNVYLFQEFQTLKRIRKARVVSIKDLYANPVQLSYHSWNKVYGAKALFAADSKIKNYYFTHKNTHFVKVSLGWKAPLPALKYENTKMAISLDSKGRFHLNNYSGALLDYKIKRSQDEVRIQVFQVIEEGFVKKLKFGRMRSEGEDLSLEIYESSYVPEQVNTDFKMTVFSFNKKTKLYDRINHFEIPAELVTKKGKQFKIAVGKLKFPARLKRKGTKLKINLSIYRKYFHHTRSVGLSGKFKI